MDRIDKINELSNRLEALINRQDGFYKEISELKAEIERLKSEEKQIETEPVAEAPASFSQVEAKSFREESVINEPLPPIQHSVPTSESKRKSNIERFIGENLISKIGIVILVIGVGIGAKFAIEHSLLSPVIRIVAVYLVGLALMGLAIKLKEKYHNYSAVLLSGSMAILYFITFAAYSFYDLIPQVLTFVLLFIFTVFTVFAAINYGQQIIAHIGLVGAYAVPFLISTDSGNTLFLFSYTAIINAGILFIAIKRYWKPLYFSAFIVTWIIYLVWYLADYTKPGDFTLALSFLSIFFLLFFGTFLAYKLINKGKFVALDVILLTSNSFIFYGLGFALFSNHFDDNQFLGLFTLITAVIHFVVAYVVYSMKLADRNLFYLLAGLVLVFLTIVFPVQFDGNWVTLFWTGEALVLFWIGRTNKVKIYEYLSYPVIVLAFFSLMQDWSVFYEDYTMSDTVVQYHIFFNMCFLTSILVILSQVSVLYLMNRNNYESGTGKRDVWADIMKVTVSVLLIVTAYFTFELEIESFWNQKIAASGMKTLTTGDTPFSYNQVDYTLESFRSVWILNYTLLFSALVSTLLIGFKSAKVFVWINLGIAFFILLFFLSKGLFDLSELRQCYLEKCQGEYYSRGVYYILIRYISYIFVAGLIVSLYRMHHAVGLKITVLFDLFIAGTILWILTSELLNWLDIAHSKNIYKLALSIFWGVYALALVIYGIWKKKTHLRIAAFGVLGITLLKLFFYDLSEMKPLSRAILFMALGVLMLGVSFLYNKYKNVIFDETKD